jgi:hypothetical protein
MIVLAITMIIGLLGWAIFSSLRHRGETAIEIAVAPSDSMITVDNQPSKPGKVYLKPGKHTIKASRQYFTDVSKVVDTKSLKPDQTIYLLPGADSPEAIKWLNDHPEELARRESIGSAQTAANAEVVEKKYPFIKDLPHRTLDYKIDYSLSGEDYKISFQITFYPVAVTPGTSEYKQQLLQYQQAALKYLKDQGIDTKTANISYSPDPNKL